MSTMVCSRKNKDCFRCNFVFINHSFFSFLFFSFFFSRACPLANSFPGKAKDLQRSASEFIDPKMKINKKQRLLVKWENITHAVMVCWYLLSLKFALIAKILIVHPNFYLLSFNFCLFIIWIALCSCFTHSYTHTYIYICILTLTFSIFNLFVCVYVCGFLFLWLVYFVLYCFILFWFGLVWFILVWLFIFVFDLSTQQFKKKMLKK